MIIIEINHRISPLKHALHQIVLLRQKFNNLAVTLLKITEWLLQTEQAAALQTKCCILNTFYREFIKCGDTNVFLINVQNFQQQQKVWRRY